MLEGVAFNLRWLLAGAEHFTGRRMDPIRLIGGGARSDLWSQILADVCDREFERVAEPLLAGLRGCGLLFAVATGQLRHSEIPELVPIDAHFRPDPRTRRGYDELFSQFPKLYSRNRAMFARLN